MESPIPKLLGIITSTPDGMPELLVCHRNLIDDLIDTLNTKLEFHGCPTLKRGTKLRDPYIEFLESEDFQ
jgi:hypothetical protein